MADKTMPTPGPWNVLEDDETEHTVVGPDLETICQTEFWGVSGLPETQANVHLIAVAGTAASEAADMGYDPVEAVRALPKLLRQIEEWTLDRGPLDRAEARLMLALHELKPSAFPAQDTCTCDDPEGCDECPPNQEWIRGMLTRAAGKESKDGR